MSPIKNVSLEFALLTVLLLSRGPCVTGISEHPLLLVVLYDGFRWDYLDKFHTPNFHSLMTNGVRAMHVQNVFPTLTMPNHYTILTGWNVQNHGIVSNNFHDTTHGTFRMEDEYNQEQSEWFDTGPEPIWVTNELQKIDRHSGSVLWPNSLAKVKGIETTYKKGPPLFDFSLKNKTRVDTIIKWFVDPDKPINLGLLYFDEPDLIGHTFGPDSMQMKDTVAGMDDITGYLIQELRSHDLFDRMNIILTADHGMTATPANQIIDVSEFVSSELYDEYQMSTIGLLDPKQGREREVYDGLKRLELKHPQISVHRRDDPLLKSIHYSDNDRIAKIVIIVEEGWCLINENSDKTIPVRGHHGYLPSVISMSPFFVAHGPAFKQSFVSTNLNTIDMYELMCHILKLSPAPNNGSLDNIRHILTDDQAVSLYSLGSICALVSVILMPLAWNLVNSRHRSPEKLE